MRRYLTLLKILANHSLDRAGRFIFYLIKSSRRDSVSAYLSDWLTNQEKTREVDSFHRRVRRQSQNTLKLIGQRICRLKSVRLMQLETSVSSGDTGTVRTESIASGLLRMLFDTENTAECTYKVADLTSYEVFIGGYINSYIITGHNI